MTVGELCEKIGNILVEVVPWLPEKKGEQWFYIPWTIALIYAFFIEENANGGICSADYSASNVKTIEVSYIYDTYFRDARCMFFIEKDTNKTYKSCGDLEKNTAEAIYYALNRNFDPKSKDKILMNFLITSEYREKFFKLKKSYRGIALKISQGNNILFKRPNNYLETAKEISKERCKLTCFLFSVRIMIILYAIAVLAKTRLLLKEN